MKKGGWDAGERSIEECWKHQQKVGGTFRKVKVRKLLNEEKKQKRTKFPCYGGKRGSE